MRMTESPQAGWASNTAALSMWKKTVRTRGAKLVKNAKVIKQTIAVLVEREGDRFVESRAKGL